MVNQLYNFSLSTLGACINLRPTVKDTFTLYQDFVEALVFGSVGAKGRRILDSS